MIRTLLMVSAVCLVASVSTLSAAVVVAGPETIANGGFHFGPHGWGSGRWRIGWDDEDRAGGDRPGAHPGAATADAARTLVWSGGDSLEVDLPGDIRFTQVQGPASVTVSGPKDSVDAVAIANGKISFDRDVEESGALLVKVAAPGVTRFALNSSGRLTIEGYSQDALALEVSGSGDVTATGEAKNVMLDISGSGDADLAGLRIRKAKVSIDGSGSAKVGPTEAADVDISGSGVARLLTRPPHLESRVSGSGRVVDPEDH